MRAAPKTAWPRALHGGRVAPRPHRAPRPFGPQEVALMAAANSPATDEAYGVRRGCAAWGMPRSSFYAARTVSEAPTPGRRRGPRPVVDDARLLEAIRHDLDRSPFSGEGHRKVWARLRALDGLRPPVPKAHLRERPCTAISTSLALTTPSPTRKVSRWPTWTRRARLHVRRLLRCPRTVSRKSRTGVGGKWRRETPPEPSCSQLASRPC